MLPLPNSARIHGNKGVSHHSYIRRRLSHDGIFRFQVAHRPTRLLSNDTFVWNGTKTVPNTAGTYTRLESGKKDKKSSKSRQDEELLSVCGTQEARVQHEKKRSLKNSLLALPIGYGGGHPIIAKVHTG